MMIAILRVFHSDHLVTIVLIIFVLLLLWLTVRMLRALMYS